ncbi:MAG: ATP-binding cassette domain-containing protein [Bacteroidales bacterium]|nr:ATP-binding cassette domain-containing protein [Bacteroidales bacterium]
MSILINDIVKTYGKQRALDGVSAEIAEGQVVGLLGPNGAGKSTLMKITTGYIRPDSGTVSVCGMDINSDPIAVRRLIGYLPEHNPLYLDMFVKEYLTMVAGMNGIADKPKRVDDLIWMTGLAPEAHKKIGALSKGYRQRVGIAQALIGDPKVVILDEPTTGLDPNQIVEVRDLIRNLATDRTVVLSTHIMQEVEATCNHIIIIDHGRIRANGTVGEVLAMAKGGQSVDVEFANDITPDVLTRELKAKVEVIAQRRFRISAQADDDDLRLTIFRLAVRHDNPILRLTTAEDMEDVFRKLTTH